MAAKKQTTKKQTTAKTVRNTTGRSGRTSSRAAERQPSVEQLRARNQREAILWFAGAILFACLALIPGANLWLIMHNFIRGLFGNWGILLSVLMAYVALSKTLERHYLQKGARLLLICLVMVFWCAAIHVFTADAEIEGLSFFGVISHLYTRGVQSGGAGLFGGLIGAPLVAATGIFVARILVVVFLVVFAMLLTGTTLMQVFSAVSRPAVAIHDVARRRREERRILEENAAAENNIDIPIEDMLPQHPVRALPPESDANAKGKKKKGKGKLKPIFAFRDPEPDADSVIIKNFDDEPEDTAARILNANNSVPDFDIPMPPVKDEPVSEDIPAPAEQPVSEPAAETEIAEQPVSFDEVQSAFKQPEEIKREAEAPAVEKPAAGKMQTVADNAAQNMETAADAEKATAAFMEKRAESDKNEAAKPAEIRKERHESAYMFPPITMLAASKKLDANVETEELQTNGRMLVETLKSFGVQTKIMDIARGPAVTRYELQPAAGVKISKITNLADDLAMNLAATGVRIEAPIPGKAAVGIEVPNKAKSIVRMRELIESNSFVTSQSRLTVALGRDIAGQVVVADLAKMPHVLIAGTTGSGKSVCINSLIVSLLYKSSPDDVRFLMIDPKVVELGNYNGIPHLLVPVVTDPRKAAGALGWAVNEMLKRYRIFAENNVRDLKGYNALAKANGFVDANGQPMLSMPQIVIIIDELSDLMMAAPNEVEDAICRLAQMARAAGMHLVVATQRPSVDVVTGLIKANIPSRIAFAVSSAVDSRTILDGGGAEKLLGQGDMLFSPVGAPKPIRVQGCFVSDGEIESVVDFVRSSKEADYDEAVAEEIERSAAADQTKIAGSDGDSDEAGDPMMNEAIKVVVEAGQASTSLLQRRLRLGYARAGRLIDEMEQMGVVGPHEGSKPRQVLMTYAQWLERNMQKPDSAE